MQQVPRDGETVSEVIFQENILTKSYLKNEKQTSKSFDAAGLTPVISACSARTTTSLLRTLQGHHHSICENISSAEVEDILYNHPALLFAAVVSKPDLKRGEVLCAFGEPSGCTSEAHHRLPPLAFKAPKAIVLGLIPKTSIGTIQKLLLRIQVKSKNAFGPADDHLLEPLGNQSRPVPKYRATHLEPDVTEIRDRGVTSGAEQFHAFCWRQARSQHLGFSDEHFFIVARCSAGGSVSAGKKLMKVLAIVLSTFIASAASASAADLSPSLYTKAPPPIAAVYNWTGWYVGANGGWAFNNNTTGNLTSFTDLFAGAVAQGSTPSFLAANHEGGFGGGQVGYNWQTANWVFGLEADFQGADIGKTSTTIFRFADGRVLTVSTGRDHIDWFGTVRGRAGVTAGSALFYATGGLAYGDVKTAVSSVANPTTAGNNYGNASDTRVGWAAGGGVEWNFASSWTLRGEYLHINLGQSNVTMSDPVNFPGTTATYRFAHVVDAVRVGVNYRIGTGASVAKY